MFDHSPSPYVHSSPSPVPPPFTLLHTSRLPFTLQSAPPSSSRCTQPSHTRGRGRRGLREGVWGAGGTGRG
eukprot:286795-Rhodomonas_salina.1